MDQFLTSFLSGLSVGAVYALVALGLVVAYRGTGHINFAQGEMGTLSAYGVWFLTTSLGLPLAVSIALGMAIGFVLAAATEAAIVRPLARRQELAGLVAIASIYLGINAFTDGVWGQYPSEVLGSLFPDDPDDFTRILGAVWRFTAIGTLVTTMAVLVVLVYVFKRTRFGLSMRLVASNVESAQLLGVRTGRVTAASWGIGGALGALAATVAAGSQGQVTPNLMLTVFIYAIAAATLGGFDSPTGAVVAGLLLGVTTNLAAIYFPLWVGQELKIGIALLLMLAVLLVRPSGLLGTARVERV